MCRRSARPRRSRRAAAWIALGLASGACPEPSNVSQGQGEIETNPVAGTLLTFDEVVFGVTERSRSRVVVVRNVGTTSLLLRSATVEGPGADRLRVSSFPRRLAPNAEGEVFVRFDPTLTGTVAPELVVRSSDLDEAVLRWPLRASAREPCRLSLTPTYEVFRLGETKTFRLTSTSSHRCVITDIATDTSLFAIESEAVPFVLEPGATTTLQVRHTVLSLRPSAPIRDLRVREREGTTTAIALEGETPLFNCLLIGPELIWFPSTPSGAVALERVRVRNRCMEPVTIADAAITRGFTTYTVLGSFPTTVPPLGTVEIPVEYRPDLVDGDGGRLTLLTSDAHSPSFSVDLYGTRATGALEVFPRQLDFGTVAFQNPRGDEGRSECTSPPRTVQIFSTGDDAVTLSRVFVAGPGDPLFQIASLVIDGRPVDFTRPQVLPAGSETQAELVFSPTRLLPPEHEARLVLEHDAGEGRTEVRLHGRGGPTGATRDVFRQAPGPKADILWVINDTALMVLHLGRLVSNASAFLASAESLQADYQMAVVTTDGTSPGAGRFHTCFPHPIILSSSYADAATREAVFRCSLDLPANGFDRSGLGAAKRALERALDPTLSPNSNAGFLRDDATLVIVFVTMQEDRTALADRVLESFFYSVKGQRGRDRVKVHAIAYPVEEPCSPYIGDPGYRYSRMTRQTGGRFYSICQPRFERVLRDLGLHAFAIEDTWELSQQADPATLTVTVDGAQIPPDLSNGWTYDPSSNSVRFHGTAVPTRGAVIEARYEELCRP